jgi:hypothetical protein
MPPDTIPLWSFDQESGVWKEEGEATYLPSEGVYEGQIEHMSLWNADQVMETTCIRGTVVDRGGRAVAGAYVMGQGVDYSGMSDAVSDVGGEFCLPVRKSSSVSVTVYLSEGGGTTQVVQSGSVTVGIPPVCSECSDVGEWVVESGEYSDSSGETVECEDVVNPFAGTCADDFWQEFAMCFQPAGECVMSMSGDISWENGASMTMQGLGDMYYYGPDGELCGTSTMDMSSLLADMESMTEGSISDFGMTYKLPSGEEFVMMVDVNNPGQMVMVCSDGTEIVIDQQQQQAMSACAGYGADDMQCTFDDSTSDMMGLCETDADCSSGEVCCDLGGGIAMCFTSDMCDMMNSSSG